MGDIWLILEIKSCFYCFSAFSCFAFPHRVYETYLGGSFLLLALRSNTNIFFFFSFFQDYSNLGQCETLEDVKLNLQETDYGSVLSEVGKVSDNG